MSAISETSSQTERQSNHNRIGAMKKNLPSHLYKGIFTGSKTISVSYPSPAPKASISKLLTTGLHGGKSSYYSSKDYQILHENLNGILSDTAPTPRLDSPKRNPILQSNSEATHEFKPTVKRLPATSNRMALKDDENERPLFVEKHRGECNPERRDDLSSKTAEHFHKKALARDPYTMAESQVRLRKQNPLDNPKYNPLVEGDERGVSIPSVRKEPAVSEASRRLNDKKAFLPSARDATSPTRVLPLHEQKLKNGSIGGLLCYEDGPRFKQEGGVFKPNQVDFKEVKDLCQENRANNKHALKRTTLY